MTSPQDRRRDDAAPRWATAALVLADGAVFWGKGVGAAAPGGGRGLLQHLDDRLPGDHHRSLLCRPDHHLHLPAYRQCRHQRRGHREHQPGRARRGAARRHHRARQLARGQAARRLAEEPQSARHLRRRHARASRGASATAARPAAWSSMRPTASSTSRRCARRAQRLARPRRHGPRRSRSRPSRATAGTRPRGRWARATASSASRATTSSPSTTASSATSCAARQRGCRVTVVPATATRRGHPAPQARRRVPVERPRRSGGDRRLRGAGDPGRARQAACRRSASASATSSWRWRSGGKTQQDEVRPPRRQPSGQGPDDRQGRDHQPEPRLRVDAANRCPTNVEVTHVSLFDGTCRASRAPTSRRSASRAIPRPRPARTTAAICSTASSSMIDKSKAQVADHAQAHRHQVAS